MLEVKVRDLKEIPELEIYTDYKENQLARIYEPGLGIFIAESAKVIRRALLAGYLPESVLVQEDMVNTELREVLKLIDQVETANNLYVVAYTASEAELTRITGYQLTRGILCAMKRKPLPSLEKICAGRRRIAILEEVMNPTNVGAIMRSAAAMKVEAVILTSGCSDPLYRRAARVSMGTVFQVPWTVLGREEWPEDGLRRLKALGFRTAAMALTEDSVSVADPEVMASPKLAIILGTEGEGLKQETIDACDYTVKIPMAEGIDSLNVAAASAVAFWQLCNLLK